MAFPEWGPRRPVRGITPVRRSAPYALPCPKTDGPACSRVVHATGGTGERCRLELYIPITRCGLLIGKGGSMYKELQQEFGVDLRVPHHSEPDGTLTIVEGPPAAVDACHQRIAMAVHGDAVVFAKTALAAEASTASNGDAWPSPGPRGPEALRDPSSIVAMQVLQKMGTQGALQRVAAAIEQDGHVNPAALATPADTRIVTAPEQLKLCEGFPHPLLGPLQFGTPEPDSNSLIVSQLPPQLDELGLYLLFAPYGALNLVHVPRDKVDSSRHMGVGYVRFSEQNSAELARADLHGVTVEASLPPMNVDYTVDFLDAGHDVAEAAETMQPVRTLVQDTANAHAAEPCQAAEDSTLRLELSIPIHRCGLLIGAGGTVLKELQHRFGVQLKIPQKTDPEGTLTVVEGPPINADLCMQEIHRCVHGDCTLVNTVEDNGTDAGVITGSSPSQPSAVAHAPPPRIYEQEPTLAAAMEGSGEVVRLELAIPISRCGLLIGKGGAVFKELQQNFGVTLKVPHHSQPDGTLTAVEGLAQNVEACVEEIGRKVRGECTIVSRGPLNSADGQ